jgi:hypothetical protein
MDINITRFFYNAEPFEYSASVAERGQNAGKETWANALAEGASAPLLKDADEIEALRDFMKGFGAWDDEEIAGWSEAECNALFIQYISGDMRELEALAMDDNGEIDWKRAEELSQEGRINGNLCRGSDGEIYYYLGN